MYGLRDQNTNPVLNFIEDIEFHLMCKYSPIVTIDLVVALIEPRRSVQKKLVILAKLREFKHNYANLHGRFINNAS